jgi:glycosyltransferase involved in cell wall biosynthesis
MDMNSAPLVSCIMPTRNRRAFAGQAILYFLRQNYQNKELIIVDDGDDDITDLVPDDKHIRYYKLDKKLRLGAKRNFACEMSKAELIAHWDDDDWMAPNRLAEQVSKIFSIKADICGADELLFYCCSTGNAWLYRYCGMDKTWLAGGTLLYKKWIWEYEKFPEIDNGEDSAFIFSLRNKKIMALRNVQWYVGIIHGTNTGAKNFADPSWRSQSLSKVSRLFALDRDFYVAVRNGLPVSHPCFEMYHQTNTQNKPDPVHHFHLIRKRQLDCSGSAKFPLVSCIMPTHNRRHFVRQAIHYFKYQDYPNRELIIIDDGSDSVRDLISACEDILYIRLSGKRNIGYKRNLACEKAKGGIIILWDDDDWYAPNRISYQVEPILENTADVTALQQGLLYCLQTQQFWTYTKELQNRMFLKGVIGGTLCFKKKLWNEFVRFPDISLAEDAAFLTKLIEQGARLHCLVNSDTFIYIRHDRNSWHFTPGNFLDINGWRRVDPPRYMTVKDQEFYSTARYRTNCELVAS